MVSRAVRAAQKRERRVVAFPEEIEARAVDITSRVRDGSADAEPAETGDEED